MKLKLLTLTFLLIASSAFSQDKNKISGLYGFANNQLITLFTSEPYALDVDGDKTRSVSLHLLQCVGVQKPLSVLWHLCSVPPHTMHLK